MIAPFSNQLTDVNTSQFLNKSATILRLDPVYRGDYARTRLLLADVLVRQGKPNIKAVAEEHRNQAHILLQQHCEDFDLPKPTELDKLEMYDQFITCRFR